MNKYLTRKPLRLHEYDYSKAGYYFVTICTALRGQDILCSITVGDGLCAVPSPDLTVGDGLCAVPSPDFPQPHPVVQLTPIGQIVDESIREIPMRYSGVKIDTYCIMPDHVHVIFMIGCELDEHRGTGRDRARPLQNMIGAMKSYTDREYRLQGMPFEAKLWQRSYYDHIIRNQEDLQNTRQYIQTNPQKWLTDKE